MSSEDLADANLIESIHEHARWQEPCEVIERDGLLMIAGHNAFPGAYRNSIVRLDPAVSAEEVIESARRLFGPRGRGFTVWTRSHRDGELEAQLLAIGLQRLNDSPCMLVEKRLPDDVMLSGIRIERFADERHVRDSAAVNAEAYQALGLAAEETHNTFQLPARVLAGHVVGYVAYEGERPVATALTILSGAGAGVYWVGTLNAAQHRGLGALCTRLATNAGFEHGAKVVTLQASPFGEPMYRRLGFRAYARLRWYRHPAPGG